MEDQNQTQPNQSTPYQANPLPNNPLQNHPVVSMGDWIVTILITAIPLVGLIMLFVWAFGGGTNPNKSNWAKASLIWILIAIVLYVIFFATIGFAFFKGLRA